MRRLPEVDGSRAGPPDGPRLAVRRSRLPRSSRKKFSHLSASDFREYTRRRGLINAVGARLGEGGRTPAVLVRADEKDTLASKSGFQAEDGRQCWSAATCRRFPFAQALRAAQKAATSRRTPKGPAFRDRCLHHLFRAFAAFELSCFLPRLSRLLPLWLPLPGGKSLLIALFEVTVRSRQRGGHGVGVGLVVHERVDVPAITGLR